jgi:hypothetical protein
MRVGSIPWPTRCCTKSDRSLTDKELPSELVPKTASPTLQRNSHWHCAVSRALSTDKSARNGVKTGDNTPRMAGLAAGADMDWVAFTEISFCFSLFKGQFSRVLAAVEPVK